MCFWAGLLGFMAIALGAYGEHGLHAVLTDAEVHAWETAVRYQMVHAVALLVYGLFQFEQSLFLQQRLLQWSARCLLAGVLVFSGSIYVAILTDQAHWMQYTPYGGGFLMLGWLGFMLAGLLYRLKHEVS